jgi:hypothetical protein
MSEDVDAVERTRQIMGGSFWENSLKSMQDNMRKQLEQQQNQQALGQMLQQQQPKPGQK